MNKILPDNNQTKIVSSFSELAQAKFQGNNNAICWQRNLSGDFQEIVLKLQLKRKHYRNFYR